MSGVFRIETLGQIALAEDDGEAEPGVVLRPIDGDVEHIRAVAPLLNQRVRLVPEDLPTRYAALQRFLDLAAAEAPDPDELTEAALGMDNPDADRVLRYRDVIARLPR